MTRAFIAEGMENGVPVAMEFVTEDTEEFLICFAAGAPNLARMTVPGQPTKVTIGSDPDEAGRAAARKCSENHSKAGAKVTCVVPIGPDDFSNQMLLNGRIEFEELAFQKTSSERNPKEEWPDPYPFPETNIMGKDISLAQIPGVFRDEIPAWANMFGAPRAFPLGGLISVIGGISSSYVKIQVREGFIASPNTYFVITGHPGQIKSPTLAPFRGFLKSIERPLAELNAAMRKNYEAAMAAFSAKESAIKKALSKKEDLDPKEKERLESELKTLYANKPKEPVYYHVFAQDATPEALVEAVACGLNLHLVPDEFATLMGQCMKKGREDLRSILLTAYSGGDTIKQLRLTRSVNVPDRISVSILSSTQPDVLLKSISNDSKELGTADGFFQRIQFVTAMTDDVLENKGGESYV